MVDSLFLILVRRKRLLLYIFGVYGLLLCVRRVLNAPNHNASQRERQHHHEPARKQLVQERRRGGVHAERARPASRLDSLVKPREARERERIVRDGTHDPVRESLVRCVAKVDCKFICHFVSRVLHSFEE